MIMYYLLQPQPFARSVTQIPRILEASIHITALAVRLVKSVQQERTHHRQEPLSALLARLDIGQAQLVHHLLVAVTPVL